VQVGLSPRARLVSQSTVVYINTSRGEEEEGKDIERRFTIANDNK
jgi:hypothetical protein